MSSTVTPERLTGRAWAVLFVLCGAIFLEGIDVSMMGVALPSIRAELGLTTGELQWIVSAYALSYGGFVLLGGRAADLLGRLAAFAYTAFLPLGATFAAMLPAFLLLGLAFALAYGPLTIAVLGVVVTCISLRERSDANG